MTSTIDFYFDFSSPYGYFASTRIVDLAEKYQREVKWHAILLGVVFQKTGGAPLPTIPLKGEYSDRDFVRTARFHDIPFKRPANFPISTTAAARAMLWLQDEVSEAKAVQFANAVYKAYFVDGVDISKPENVVRVGASIGVDEALMMDGIGSPGIKEQLKEKVAQAMEVGVFGSPYVVVDGEPFWGFDRFDQLEATLKSGKI